MRWSQAFIPTLRDDPAGAEAVSHKLLVRAGFIRQLSAGHYSMLPLGQRTRLKVEAIIRQEMDRIGGQEVVLPTLHPAEVWRASGRYDLMGDNLFKLVDRRGDDHVLGMTEEELFAMLATEITSYRQLPQIWYQIHTKYRDEARAKSGLLRVREFTMKDAYTLDVDAAGLDVGFDKHRGAYQTIFKRLGLEAVDVEASSGAMGGRESVEFIIRSEAGEDWIVSCPNCDYRANLERAVSRVDPVDDGEASPPGRLATPGIRTIAALAQAHPDVASPERQLKTLVYVVDGVPTLAVVRGDHDLHEQKLIDATGAAEVRPAQADEVVEGLGASPGSLGAVGVTDHPIYVDEALRGRREMVTGANQDDWHLVHVDVERDIPEIRWADLRVVGEGEPCVVCGTPLERWKGIEVGHIFKLGTKFSEAFGATVQDDDGRSHPIVMGSYGIGVERNMAAIVESNHDDAGIVWPVSVAPYEVVLTVLRPDDDAAAQAAGALYRDLLAREVEALIDDRPERPGVKFADAELIGIPWRVTVGPRGVASGTVELTERATMQTTEVPIAELVDRVTGLVGAGRRMGTSG